MILFWLAGWMFTFGVVLGRKDMGVDGFWHGVVVFVALWLIWPAVLGIFLLDVLEFWGMKFEPKLVKNEKEDGK